MRSNNSKESLFPEGLQPPQFKKFSYPNLESKPSKKAEWIFSFLIIPVVLAPLLEPYIYHSFLEPQNSLFYGEGSYEIFSKSVLLGGLISLIIHEKVHQLMFWYYGYNANVRWRDMYTIANDQKVYVNHYIKVSIAPIMFISILLILVVGISSILKPDMMPWGYLFYSLFGINVALAGADLYQYYWLSQNCDKNDFAYMRDVPTTDRFLLNKHRTKTYIYRNN